MTRPTLLSGWTSSEPRESSQRAGTRCPRNSERNLGVTECAANEIAERVGSVPGWASVHCRTGWKRQAPKRASKTLLPHTSATPHQPSLVTLNWGGKLRQHSSSRNAATKHSQYPVNKWFEDHGAAGRCKTSKSLYVGVHVL